ncbi:hypothetical protein [Rossellomorea marisflavi]|uniref:hypothetical protein n=1 Tax=Rossellomorea marisflavi TaxID=189381 RepID=UPI003FA084C2
MKIFNKQQKEVIEVLHENVKAMHANVEKLLAEGWSGNVNVSSYGSDKYPELTDEDIRYFKKEHPEIEIQYPKTRSFARKNPFVLLTTHERFIETDTSL